MKLNYFLFVKCDNLKKNRFNLLRNKNYSKFNKKNIKNYLFFVLIGLIVLALAGIHFKNLMIF